MAPGAAAARRGCPAAACAPLRAATPTLPAAQGGGRRNRSLTSRRGAEGPPGAGRARGPWRRRAESPPGLAGRLAALLLLPTPRRPGPRRCSAAATSCCEYFPRLPARPPPLRAAVLAAAALCPLRSPPPGSWSRAAARTRALSPLPAWSPSLISDREPAKNSP